MLGRLIGLSGEKMTFAYGKLLPLSFIAVGILFLGLVVYFASISNGISNAMVALAVITIFAIVLFFGISPLLTSHEITGNFLILRQGWYFNRAIPLKYVDNADHFSGKTYGLSIKYRPHLRRLYVLTDERNKIILTMRDDVYIKIFLRRNAVREIVINVNNTKTFIDKINSIKKQLYDSLEYREKIGREMLSDE